ncbi:unnamed protein product [Arabis nemorensis]|uniref:Lipoxygenase domain-containing protein n=1 Tax=Arabis nemorensis TaxID=586526 RepID=A0A565BBN8_9BRAS|nr:unnamed protein product [Arabis nemorensis]
MKCMIFNVVVERVWRTDEEFAREMLADLNPVVISRLQESPPKSNLDSPKYGNQHSSIREEQVKPYMNGLNVKEALEQNKLYILDHHHIDAFLDTDKLNKHKNLCDPNPSVVSRRRNTETSSHRVESSQQTRRITRIDQ